MLKIANVNEIEVSVALNSLTTANVLAIAL